MEMEMKRHAALERKIANLREREAQIVARIEKLKVELRETRWNISKREATKEMLHNREICKQQQQQQKQQQREQTLDEILDEIAAKYD